LARAVAPTASGAIIATFWESAEARESYQSQPEHHEALQASGMLDLVTDMRSTAYDDAELRLP
jgi:heme-degrading monooxygenase HmoA